VTRIIRTAWALLLFTSACSSGGALPVQPGTGDLNKTGLEGTARRGPIQPVCREGEACDAPLQAGFTLRQDDRVVVPFISDSTGHFLIYVAPGTYVVVPDEPIGIGLQTLEVTVKGGGLTHVDLTFDTGIR
jgi:hypothetical protein